MLSHHVSQSSKPDANQPPKKKDSSNANDNKSVSTKQKSLEASATQLESRSSAAETGTNTASKARKSERRDPDDEMSSSTKRLKRDIILTDKQENLEVRERLHNFFFNRRDMGYGVADWPKVHHFQPLEMHPMYAMKKVSKKYTTNTCMHCEKGRPGHWCQECSFLHLYPITVCFRCRQVHEEVMNEASSASLSQP